MRRLVLLSVVLFFSPGVAGAEWNIYFSNIHSHTSYSDGIGTPAEAYDYARYTAQIDILAITDHTNYLTTTEWNDTQAAANSATVDGVFVGLCGQEFGLLSAEGFGHVAIFDTANRCNVSRTDLLATYSWIGNNGGIGQFNHPNPDPQYGSNFNSLTYYPVHDGAMELFEVRNGRRADNYEPQYIQALNNGWHVSPTGDQDNHEGMWGDQPNPSSGNDIYLSGVIADTLTRAAVYDALRNHRTYCVEVNPVNDRIFCLYYGDGQIMGSQIHVEDSVNLSAQAWTQNGVTLFSTLYVYDNGTLIYSDPVLGTTVNWSRTIAVAPGTEHYFFIRIRQVDGDNVWTSPIWVDADLLISAETPPPANGLALHQNAPNPFADGTSIRFSAPEGGVPRARLAVYDVTGREIRVLHEGPVGGGPGNVSWDGRDESGRAAPAGIYFYRLETPGWSQTRRMVLWH
jgi:hypothetical protein